MMLAYNCICGHAKQLAFEGEPQVELPPVQYYFRHSTVNSSRGPEAGS